MNKIVIEGGKKLKGNVLISGAKNAALPLMAATLLGTDSFKLKHLPNLADIHTMAMLLSSFGAKIDEKRHSMTIDNSKIKNLEATYERVRTMRASVLVLGPLLARYGSARVSLPGGCAIGARPIDRHLKALEEMGAKINLKGGYVEAKAKKLHGAHIVFDDVTVTGTENILMAATLAKGETIIENAAREPEVDDLVTALQIMGAQIEGKGTDTLKIQGVTELQGISYRAMADRIEAGTYLIAACMNQGDITIKGISPKYLTALLSKLEEAGARIELTEDEIRAIGPQEIQATSISTQAYPGFATDFQAQFMSLMCLAKGTSVVSENIFENRFMHVQELVRMGANISIEGKSAIIKGVERLNGAPVMATDLRASACLVLAGLAAKGITEIHRVYHLDRGYEKIVSKFRGLGARIKKSRVKY